MQLQIPHYQHRLRRNQQGRIEIFDIIRKKWLLLRAEEWVRQQFVRWLIEVHAYPPGLIAIEQAVKGGLRMWRADIVVYDPQGAPFLLVECKQQNTKLDIGSLLQASQYNAYLQAPYWAITNGHTAIILHNSKQQPGFCCQIQHIPAYPSRN